MIEVNFSLFFSADKNAALYSIITSLIFHCKRYSWIRKFHKIKLTLADNLHNCIYILMALDFEKIFQIFKYTRESAAICSEIYYVNLNWKYKTFVSWAVVAHLLHYYSRQEMIFNFSIRLFRLSSRREENSKITIPTNIACKATQIKFILAVQPDRLNPSNICHSVAIVPGYTIAAAECTARESRWNCAEMVHSRCLISPEVSTNV